MINAVNKLRENFEGWDRPDRIAGVSTELLIWNLIRYRVSKLVRKRPIFLTVFESA
jgi:hypothetical protein